MNEPISIAILIKFMGRKQGHILYLLLYYILLLNTGVPILGGGYIF